MRTSSALVSAATAAALALTGGALAVAAEHDPQAIVALTADDQLLRTTAGRANRATVVDITGLGPGESLVGIDVRPRTGVLYGLSDASRLYTINPSTGVATPGATLAVPIQGTAFGVDFNPAADRLRVVSDEEQSLRINVDNGVTLVDGSLAYVTGDANEGADPNVVAAAYTNNDNDAATGTQLFDIDSDLDVLVLQDPPNAGGLKTIGALGVDAGDLTGFDIASTLVAGRAVADTAYASVDGPGGSQHVHRIDLATGTATRLSPFTGQFDVVDLAVLPAS
jgi:trimeric autotransporter adhesin